MAKTIVILTNIGSPATPSTKDVAAYLKEFLLDKRVINLPTILRHLLVKGIIVPFRKKYSANLYKRIWDSKNQEFPLIHYTKKIAAKLQNEFPSDQVEIHFAMRYGQPSGASVVKQISSKNPQRIIIFPLFPHYAMSSYETSVIHLQQLINRDKDLQKCKQIIISPFYHDTTYQKAIVESIKKYLETKSYDKILFSYHSIPQKHLNITTRTLLGKDHHEDCCQEGSPEAEVCYQYQTKKSTKLTSALLQTNIPIEVSYQSRLGRTKWLTPYTSDRIKQLPQEGVKRLLVITPSFICDCLESIDEIAIRAKEEFISHGGESLDFVPCLNDSPLMIECLKNIVAHHL